MNPLKPLTTPEYFFRPRQILHRFVRALQGNSLPEFQTVTLPWNEKIRVRPSEVVGSGIWCYGVFDLPVTEAICRLLDKSETAADIGANIGQMTSLMRQRVGPSGKVISFEPHPDIFSELRFNVETLSNCDRVAPVELHNIALSDKVGEAFLDVGPSWSINRGMARLVSAESNTPQGLIAVKSTLLDDVLGDDTQIGVCKIDVEGHELQVLKGAARLLATRRIRDIVFEDLDPFPSPVHKHLGAHGFTIFSLHSRLWGPRLVPATTHTRFTRMRDGRNYLATLDPERVINRFRALGWKTLRGGE